MITINLLFSGFELRSKPSQKKPVITVKKIQHKLPIDTLKHLSLQY